MMRRSAAARPYLGRVEAVPTLLMLRVTTGADIDSVRVDEVIRLFEPALTRSDWWRLQELLLVDGDAVIPLTRHNASVLRKALRRR